MAASTIYVNYPDGSPGANLKVALSFTNGGMTKDFFTNNRGEVTITHDGKGEATVFVRGVRKHKFRAPGTTSVTV